LLVSVAWDPLLISRHDIVNPGVASDQINFFATPSKERRKEEEGKEQKAQEQERERKRRRAKTRKLLFYSLLSCLGDLHRWTK
jgi:hypothetical protein